MTHDINTFETLEGTTPDYVVTIVDKDDNPVPGSVLDSLTLTVYQEYTEAIVNNRDDQNVLQINGVTVDENGRLRWVMTPDDTAILDDKLHQEPHVAQFEMTYPGVNGTEASSHEVRILITNLQRTP